ncbi:hypothetical protein TNCV_1347581 [Trichonephila clavipes]|nr:hypothetical protein TNCV_1347581 [Trichonephila clavipes]
MQRLWQDLPQGVISDLIESMPRRISACIAARGSTEYSLKTTGPRNAVDRKVGGPNKLPCQGQQLAAEVLLLRSKSGDKILKRLSLPQ